MLITLEQMKEYLGIDSGDTTYDVFLTNQIELISAAIEEYCRRPFSPKRYTETFYYNFFERLEKYIPLHVYPVINLVSAEIVYRDEDEVEEDRETIKVRLHKPSGRLERLKPYNAFPWCSPDSEIQVVYDAGFEVLPAPVKNVIFSLVEERYNKKKAGIDINFGQDVQRINIPGTIGIDFDYTLQNNERTTTMGVVLGSYVNVLDSYRSDRAIVQEEKLRWIEVEDIPVVP